VERENFYRAPDNKARINKMPPFKKIVKTLMKRAMEKGAKSVKLIPTRDVFVEDFVRQKCRYEVLPRFR